VFVFLMCRISQDFTGFCRASCAKFAGSPLVPQGFVILRFLPVISINYRYQDLPDGLSISMKCRLDYLRRAYGVVHTIEI
jgi:hypothetical protein